VLAQVDENETITNGYQVIDSQWRHHPQAIINNQLLLIKATFVRASS